MSTERRKPYPFDQIEPKRQKIWETACSFHAPNPGEPGFDPSKPKYYVMDMFPYPSGEGLHVGHPEGYTATDIIARFKRMRGFNVLHPMGWDAFGLPAEQYAIKTGQHPAVTTARNVARFKLQLQKIGFAYDWQREVNTTDPGYYRWTQWIFLQIYHSWFNPATQRAEPISTYTGENPDEVRLAYIGEAAVNWCPALGTVLANEEVIDGKSDVGGHPVERRPMRQWKLRITAYAQRLIDELDGLDWPESIKLLQRNWIGRSEGAEVRFPIADSDQTITVFTTRPDTLYGATYMVLAPEHALVDQIVTEEQWPAVREYRERTARKSDLERTELAKEKTGVWTGAYAVNPVNGQRIPVWIADYVLLGYGTGAIMAVPAHDERDWEFARKYALPIREVVTTAPTLGLGGGGVCEAEPLECLPGEGFAIHSGPLDGLPTADAKREITRLLEEQGLGRKTVNFKLRDWLFSRQRYWGEPFPIVWEGGHHRGIGEEELPLQPPALEDFKPTGTGEPPLAKATEWLRYSEQATRETNTMPQWAGSCWYYLRYIDPNNRERFTGKDAERYWMTGEAAAHSANPQPAAPNPDPGSSAASSNPQSAALNLDPGSSAASSNPQSAALNLDPGSSAASSNPQSAALNLDPGSSAASSNPQSAALNLDPGSSAASSNPQPAAPNLDPGSSAASSNPQSAAPNPDPGSSAASSNPQSAAPNPDPGSSAASSNPQSAAPNPDPGSSAASANPQSAIRNPQSKGGVDLYVGGTEHAVLHLMYARFWHKVLFDLGHVSTLEPFQRLVNQGMILGEDGQKMSKSRGNVVNPDDVITGYGADALRCYEMFMGPLEQTKPWSMTGVEGVSRFLARVWRLAMEENQAGEWEVSPAVQDVELDKAQLKVIHATVKKVGEDIESLGFNTAIAQMMVFVNAFTNANPRPRSAIRTLLQVLNPFAPHLTEELWERLGFDQAGARPLAAEPWPAYEERFLIEDEIEIVLQVNGKLRDKIIVPKDASKEAVEAAARNSAKIAEWTAGKEIRKVVVVPGRLVNLVVG